MTHFLPKLSASAIATLSMAATAWGWGELPDHLRNKVKVNGITWAGKGCPVGSATGTISQDRQAFTVIFDEFFAEAAPDLSRSARRSACQINVDMVYPAGYQFSIFDVDYRGYVDLNRYAYGEVRSEYYFTGGRGPVLRTGFDDYDNGDFMISDRLGVESIVYSPCGVNRPLNIKTSISIRGSRRAEGFIGIDSVDGEFKHIYGIKWRPC